MVWALEAFERNGDVTATAGRPFVLIQGGDQPSEVVLGDVRDYLRDHATQLPSSDEWRDALLGIAADLDQALELRAHGPGRPGRCR